MKSMKAALLLSISRYEVIVEGVKELLINPKDNHQMESLRDILGTAEEGLFEEKKIWKKFIKKNDS